MVITFSDLYTSYEGKVVNITQGKCSCGQGLCGRGSNELPQLLVPLIPSYFTNALAMRLTRVPYVSQM